MDAQELDNRLQNLRKKMTEDFVKEVKASTPEALKNKVVAISQEVQKVDSAKANDNKLKVLRTQIADLNGGYRDLKKKHSQEREYVLLTLLERGVE